MVKVYCFRHQEYMIYDKKKKWFMCPDNWCTCCGVEE